MKNIAIIGAGWSGLQIGKVLLDCGYQVTIFESLDDVGGTWHPKTAYYGQTLHSAAYTIEFVDFPMDYKSHNPLKKLDAPDVFTYTQDYAKHSGLYEHIIFNTAVKKINYLSAKDQCIVTTINTITNAPQEFSFDYVISTQFNFPKLPHFTGQEIFKGKIYHTNEIKEELFNQIITTNKKVVLLGGSKSGTDFAYAFAMRNYNINWVLRQMYWFFSYDKRYFNYKTGKKPKIYEKLIYLSGLKLMDKKHLKSLGHFIWQLGGIIKCPGKKHYNYKKFHTGILDQHQFDVLSKHCKQIYSEIDRLTEYEVYLKDGSKLMCDVIICGTGATQISDQLILQADGVTIKMHDVDKIYKYSVIPEIPRLCFTGFLNFSLGPVNAYTWAAWILKFIEDNHTTQDLINKSNKKDLWRFTHGNALFNNENYFYYGTIQKEKQMTEGIFTHKDLINHLLTLNFRYKLVPFAGVKRFIESRIVKKQQ